MKIKIGSITAEITTDDRYNYISVSGTDDFRDLLVSLNCRNNEYGYHVGCYRAADRLFDALFDEICHLKPIKLKGHSMGGGIAECLSYLLRERLFAVQSCILYGSYGVLSKRYDNKTDYKLTRIRCGRDIIPFLFLWNHCKPDETIQGCAEPWPIRFAKDHNGYPKRKYDLFGNE